jgi:hypothetical protein
VRTHGAGRGQYLALADEVSGGLGVTAHLPVRRVRVLDDCSPLGTTRPEGAVY